MLASSCSTSSPASSLLTLPFSVLHCTALRCTLLDCAIMHQQYFTTKSSPAAHRLLASNRSTSSPASSLLTLPSSATACVTLMRCADWRAMSAACPESARHTESEDKDADEVSYCPLVLATGCVLWSIEPCAICQSARMRDRELGLIQPQQGWLERLSQAACWQDPQHAASRSSLSCRDSVIAPCCGDPLSLAHPRARWRCRLLPPLWLCAMWHLHRLLAHAVLLSDRQICSSGSLQDRHTR